MNINRRNFIKSLLTATAGFNILPPASTYDRIWRATPQPILVTPNNLFDWFWYDSDGTRHEVWENRNIVKHVTVVDFQDAVEHAKRVIERSHREYDEHQKRYGRIFG